ncbi:MAG TPA: hypothetical protein VGA03_12560 [Anaerolineales bacterium]
MEARIGFIFKRISRVSYVLGSVCLLAGLILSYVNIPASAAEPNLQEDTTPVVQEELACTPPDDWDRTIRFNRSNPSKEWTFQVEEPEMDVTLEFIYYQDYDQDGCPFDCATGECQDYETGDVESPFGSFSITDGKEGADGGVERQSGVLSQGTYTASFTFTGRRGSINVGLNVKMDSIATDTPVPTDVPPSTDTPTPTDMPSDTPTPTAILTDTPTPTGTIESATSTATPVTTTLPPGPSDTPTPTATGTLPTQTPTETEPPITTVLPPAQTTTPTEVERTPPATLSPPTPPPGAVRTPAIIPVTGLDRVYSDPQSILSQNQFLNLGIGFLGLGLVFHGISRKFRKQ